MWFKKHTNEQHLKLMSCVYLYINYRNVIWNICPKLTCCVLLLYPCSISPNRVSLKRTSCLRHFGPSQFSDCRRQERPSPANLYSWTHLRTRHNCQWNAPYLNIHTHKVKGLVQRRKCFR